MHGEYKFSGNMSKEIYIYLMEKKLHTKHLHALKPRGNKMLSHKYCKQLLRNNKIKALKGFKKIATNITQ